MLSLTHCAFVSKHEGINARTYGSSHLAIGSGAARAASHTLGGQTQMFRGQKILLCIANYEQQSLTLAPGKPASPVRPDSPVAPLGPATPGAPRSPVAP